MKYPKLVRAQDCRIDIHIVLYGEGVSENGAPLIVLEDDFKCNYQDSAKRILTKEKAEVQISGIALFHKDIAPNLAVISSGEVTIFGEKRQIYKGTKARNPDGTVNYIRLELV